jgi:hypothetical protein
MRETSEAGIKNGLAPSWSIREPSCANVTYHSQNLYTHRVTLEKGRHTLHVGSYMRTPTASQWRGGASIEIVGLISPVFPVFVDTRTKIRYPGCVSGTGVVLDAEVCPNDAVWVTREFEAAIGQGGAIYSQNTGSISIDGSTFRTNAAARGSSVTSVAASVVSVHNTKFDDVHNAFLGEAVTIQVHNSNCTCAFR